MRILLDTHVFIWMTSDAKRLSELARTLIADPAHIKYFSLVSAWEIQIKLQIGKLMLNGDLRHIINTQQNENGLQILTLTLPHIVQIGELPLHHNDPFDRLLIAQALVEDFVLLTHDEKFKAYDIDLRW